MIHRPVMRQRPKTVPDGNWSARSRPLRSISLCFSRRRKISQDLVYSGHNLIAENGIVLAESQRFTNHYIETEIDVDRLAADRRKMTTFGGEEKRSITGYILRWKKRRQSFVVLFPKRRFIPANKADRDKRAMKS